MAKQTLHIHLVSDSTGETVHQVARACVAQFPNVTAVEHVWTLVRSEAHLESVCAGLDRNPGVLLMSIVNDDMRDSIAKACQSRGIPAVSILDPVVNLLGRVLGQATQNLPGGQRRLNTAYFDRVAAVDFAVSHDDGMNMGQLDRADILLVGVSRTSKTPTSMYLAHRGYKVANYALVPNVPFPLHYLDRLNLLVVGLTNVIQIDGNAVITSTTNNRSGGDILAEVENVITSANSDVTTSYIRTSQVDGVILIGQGWYCIR